MNTLMKLLSGLVFLSSLASPLAIAADGPPGREEGSPQPGHWHPHHLTPKQHDVLEGCLTEKNVPHHKFTAEEKAAFESCKGSEDRHACLEKAGIKPPERASLSDQQRADMKACHKKAKRSPKA